MDMPKFFTEACQAALTLLRHGCATDRKTAEFLGVMAADFDQPTVKQRKWLDDLLEKNDLPPLLT